jgi:hypothetical protein
VRLLQIKEGVGQEATQQPENTPVTSAAPLPSLTLRSLRLFAVTPFPARPYVLEPLILQVSALGDAGFAAAADGMRLSVGTVCAG